MFTYAERRERWESFLQRIHFSANFHFSCATFPFLIFPLYLNFPLFLRFQTILIARFAFLAMNVPANNTEIKFMINFSKFSTIFFTIAIKKSTKRTETIFIREQRTHQNQIIDETENGGIKISSRKQFSTFGKCRSAFGDRPRSVEIFRARHRVRLTLHWGVRGGPVSYDRKEQS